MTLRIGILGAARIAPAALVGPARAHRGVEVSSVAARDPHQAEEFARRHGVARVAPSYQALIEDPDLDAIYNPLPAALHGHWTIAALEAGKHVLCEKPFTANAAEAEKVVAAATRADRTVMEAFHYRYHPLTLRMLQVIENRRLGRLRHLEAWFRVRITDAHDIRWDAALGGGSLMDIGCYPLHLLRTLTGAEPEVLTASAEERSPGVDRTLRAELDLGGVRGRLSSAMLSRRGRGAGAVIVGTHGTMRVSGFVGPQAGNHLQIRDRRGVWSRTVAPDVTSYSRQLAAFHDAAVEGAVVPTSPADAVAQMRAIDALYRAAGLEPRAPAPAPVSSP